MTDKIELIRKQIIKCNQKLAELNIKLKQAESDRPYECDKCNHIQIEKDITLIKEYSYHRSYNSYEDPSYEYRRSFIVCTKCFEWLVADDIKYPKNTERYCSTYGYVEIPKLCKPLLERQEKEYQEERLAKKKKEDIEKALKLLKENGIEVS